MSRRRIAALHNLPEHEEALDRALERLEQAIELELRRVRLLRATGRNVDHVEAVERMLDRRVA